MKQTNSVLFSESLLCFSVCLQLNADLKSVDEDKDRLFAKLDDEVKAKEDLQGESAAH